ncbi:ABC1 kinase family protein [Vibrio sp. WXL210]|uniref:ABC1 kinase family protein n=1 Tax=Vibrio sp. WXL210 TaxID=3450709 RepID=UPI003EC4DE12
MLMKESNLPTHRVARFGKFASLATRVATNVVTEGSKQWFKGQRPNMRDLVLTPHNIAHLADQLAQLRGAAMKLGQMLSMDAGELIDPDLAEILARLRSDANPMPAKQLAQALEDGLGVDWKQHFLAFNFKPVASASIGQVHHAYAENGDSLAIKVQYPGIRKSIDSDVDNVGTLLNMVGLIPEGVNYSELLEDAKQQLHFEADYQREARFAERYGQLLAGDSNFVVPKIIRHCSSDSVLSMEYLNGIAIEDLAGHDQATRDHVMTKLLELLFKEIFEYRLVQTDPNFANYLYLEETQQIGLLDFGATREYDERICEGYRLAFAAVMRSDNQGLNAALEQIGFFSEEIADEQRQSVLNLVSIACEPMLVQGRYNFATSDLAPRLRDAGAALSLEQGYWHTPPVEALFLHRKIAGLYLLAARLKVRVDIHKLVQCYL